MLSFSVIFYCYFMDIEMSSIPDDILFISSLICVFANILYDQSWTPCCDSKKISSELYSHHLNSMNDFFSKAFLYLNCCFNCIIFSNIKQFTSTENVIRLYWSVILWNNISSSSLRNICISSCLSIWFNMMYIGPMGPSLGLHLPLCNTTLLVTTGQCLSLIVIIIC